MDSNKFGKTIFKLRKKRNMTQSKLASLLNITDKTVSKWENGVGFPDVAMLPKLSRIFGVSIDYLINDGTSGITVAGIISSESIHIMKQFPTHETPAEIIDTIYTVGGCVSLVSVNLTKIDRGITVVPIGKVGNDEKGRELLSALSSYGLYTGKIKRDSSVKTAYSSINFENVTKKRIFSYFNEANDAFNENDIVPDELDCKIFHIGYVPMLKSLDSPDKNYGTKLAALLRQISLNGIKTSISVATRSDIHFFKKIFPVLKYTDYAIMDEWECCKIGGGLARMPDRSLKTDVIKNSMKKIFEYGVREKVIVLCWECSFIMNANGDFYSCPAYITGGENLKGTFGFREAFEAGCLYALYSGYDDKDILEFALMASACSMTEFDALSGMKSADEIKYMLKNNYFRNEKEIK